MTMTRIIVTYGMIGGVIVAALMIFNVASGAMGYGTWSMVFGYASMLIALSVVFVGIKRYRDEAMGGVIRFGTALKLGAGIALVASLLYVLGWEAYMYATNFSFTEQYTAALLAEQRAAGATEAQLAASAAEMESFAEWYADPLVRMPLTFAEIAPVALLVTLVSALLLKNPRFMPAIAD